MTDGLVELQEMKEMFLVIQLIRECILAYVELNDIKYSFFCFFTELNHKPKHNFSQDLNREGQDELKICLFHPNGYIYKD